MIVTFQIGVDHIGLHGSSGDLAVYGLGPNAAAIRLAMLLTSPRFMAMVAFGLFYPLS
jgi:hypothetical protein